MSTRRVEIRRIWAHNVWDTIFIDVPWDILRDNLIREWIQENVIMPKDVVDFDVVWIDID